MEKNKLIYDLAASLQKIYDTEAFTTMLEYCQGELRVLLYLSMHEGNEICPSDLSDALEVTRQRITSVLSALRKKELIHMEMAQDDRRKMLVTLTESGRKYFAEKEKSIMRYFNVLVDGLGESNTSELTRIINLSIEQFRHFKK